MKVFLVVLSILLMITAVIFSSIGGKTMYEYGYFGHGEGHIVGGDAYNYIIIANRGIGLISIGIVSALLSVTFAIFSLLCKEELNPSVKDEEINENNEEEIIND